MIKIKNLVAGISEKEILKGIDIKIELGKNYGILGKNGSGKSTFSSVLMGNPKYRIFNGSIEIDGEDLITMPPEERSKKGIFLSFQNVPEISGIKLSEFLRTIYNIHLKNENPDQKDISPFIFLRFVKKYLEELKIDESFLSRDLNVGFSGGEKRKIEILQMKLIGPKYIILDEIDSGLDLDAFKKVANFIKAVNNKSNSLIIITHHFNIFDYVEIDKVYILQDGLIKKKGGNKLIEEIKNKGYESI